MPDLGLEVLLKGKNAVRLLGGLWVALRVSLISVAISIPLGILLGVLMTKKNRLVRAVLRIYLEIIRIMPQMVLLFLVFFGTTRACRGSEDHVCYGEDFVYAGEHGGSGRWTDNGHKRREEVIEKYEQDQRLRLLSLSRGRWFFRERKGYGVGDL